MTLRIGIARPGGYVVRTIRLEDYVAGVLAGEAARNSSPSALEALAITVRTYALANLSRHRADGFDLCDLTHCQVLRKATLATETAATANGRKDTAVSRGGGVRVLHGLVRRTNGTAVACLARRVRSGVSAVARRRCVRWNACLDG